MADLKKNTQNSCHFHLTAKEVEAINQTIHVCVGALSDTIFVTTTKFTIACMPKLASMSNSRCIPVQETT